MCTNTDSAIKTGPIGGCTMSCASIVIRQVGLYKDFPILGEPSELAAKAALASSAQGKHQDFYEALLSAHADMIKDEMLKIAAGVGLDAKRLETDMANPKW